MQQEKRFAAKCAELQDGSGRQGSFVRADVYVGSFCPGVVALGLRFKLFLFTAASGSGGPVQADGAAWQNSPGARGCALPAEGSVQAHTGLYTKRRYMAAARVHGAGRWTLTLQRARSKGEQARSWAGWLGWLRGGKPVGCANLLRQVLGAAHGPAGAVDRAVVAGREEAADALRVGQRRDLDDLRSERAGGVRPADIATDRTEQPCS